MRRHWRTVVVVPLAVLAAWLVLVGISEHLEDRAAQRIPVNGQCAEFDHRSLRGDRHVTCRMTWCGGMNGGPAVLWCDDDEEAKNGGASLEAPRLHLNLGQE